MIEVRKTTAFVDWLDALRDVRAKVRIIARLLGAEAGNLGDAKAVGGGVSEMRVDVGAGYRVYFTHRGATLIVLLCGGDKSSQAADIARAKRMAKTVE